MPEFKYQLWAGVFDAGKSFILTGLGGALKFHILLHVYIEQFLK